MTLIQGTLEGNVQSINFGSTTPAAADRDKPWFRIGADGTPDKFYSYSNGSWLARHPIVPGIVCLYEGSSASITTLDGGESAVITTTTGPFWEQVTQMAGRVPLGPGTLTLSGTVVAVGDTGGVDRHTLTVSEMPAHTHDLRVGGSGQADAGSIIETALNQDTPQGTAVTQSSGGGTSHQNMPPYLGIFAIRRTARLYYRQ